MNRRNYGQPAPLRRLPPKPGHKAIVLRPIRTPDRPPRNKDCPCLSGKKYKHCCKDIATLVETLAGKIEAHETTTQSKSLANHN